MKNPAHVQITHNNYTPLPTIPRTNKKIYRIKYEDGDEEDVIL